MSTATARPEIRLHPGAHAPDGMGQTGSAPNLGREPDMRIGKPGALELIGAYDTQP
jgi:hypothetical protein